MNWDAIGAIAELLGAIGVIASLVYLATQIRQSREQMGQNTRAMQAGAYQQFDQTLHTTIMEALHVPGLYQVAQSGMDDFEQLNEEDVGRFNLWMTGVMKRFDAAYYQYRGGMLEEDRWQLPLGDLRGFLRNPGIAQWWRAPMRGATFSPEFVALVSEILGEEPNRAD